jgi:hypothetical protein
MLNNHKSYTALVRSLELSAEEASYDKLDDKYYDESFLRDMTEKMCLMFVLQLINKFDVKDLIRAKFIEKWLVRQNWGEGDEERQRNFESYVKNRRNRIADICHWVLEEELGKQALVKVKLLPEGSQGIRALEEDYDKDNFSLLRDGNNSEGGLQPRILEQSAEEQRLRRQHRQAMVWNDGTHPLDSGDIIEPGRD